MEPALSEPGRVVEHADELPHSPHDDRYVRDVEDVGRPVELTGRQLIPREPGTETRPARFPVGYTEHDQPGEPPNTGGHAAIAAHRSEVPGEHEPGAGHALTPHLAPAVPHWTDDPVED